MSMKGCNQVAARILREAREKTDRPLGEIAAVVGHKGPWLGKVERGQIRVRLCEFLALAAKLGLDPIEAVREIRKAL